jgi:hypothetical protein
MEPADLQQQLFPGDYVGEPLALPGLKLVGVPATAMPGQEYAIVRFYLGLSGATAMRTVLRSYDCADAKRQYRRFRRTLLRLAKAAEVSGFFAPGRQ